MKILFNLFFIITYFSYYFTIKKKKQKTKICCHEYHFDLFLHMPVNNFWPHSEEALLSNHGEIFFLKKFYVAMPQFPFFLIYNFIKSDTASVTIFFILYFCNILIPYNAHFFHFDKCILSFWEYHYIHIVPLLKFTPTQSFFFRKSVFRFLQPDISRNI